MPNFCSMAWRLRSADTILLSAIVCDRCCYVDSNCFSHYHRLPATKDAAHSDRYAGAHDGKIDDWRKCELAAWAMAVHTLHVFVDLAEKFLGLIELVASSNWNSSSILDACTTWMVLLLLPHVVHDKISRQLNRWSNISWDCGGIAWHRIRTKWWRIHQPWTVCIW